MKYREDLRDGRQSAYLLAYDRRCILDCADTFFGLASVCAQMGRDEQFGTQVICGEKAAGWQALQSRQAADSIDRQALQGRQAADSTEQTSAAVQTDWQEERELCLQRQLAQENQRRFAAQMRQLAGMLQAVAGTKVQLIRLGGRQEKQIVRALAQEGLVVWDIFLLRGPKGHLEISMTLHTKKDISVTVEEVAGYLSVLMDIRLMSQKRNPYFIGMKRETLYFEEEPVYCFMTGAAAAIRENEKVSGDSFSFFEEDGAVSVILSDGVGSGEKAAADSSRIVDLTEQMLEAGLEPQLILQTLNGMVGAGGNEMHMATLDFCRIDLRDASAVFCKAGGVASYIKRGENVEKIQGGSLPLGLGEELQHQTGRQLSDGDMVILLSDGILQDWPTEDGEDQLMERMEQLHARAPVDLANQLLAFVLEQCRGQIRDDMTVLVIGLWENKRGD